MTQRRGRDNNSDQDERTIDDVLADVEHRMGQSIEAMRRDISTLRTGRATPSLIEDLPVDYYGTPTPLKQIASISAPMPAPSWCSRGIDSRCGTLSAA